MANAAGVATGDLTRGALAPAQIGDFFAALAAERPTPKGELEYTNPIPCWSR